MITLLAELTIFYAESHRHYHTIEHISSMLLEARETSLSEEQILAIWLHDVIYDPRSHTDEFESAKFATRWLDDKDFPPERIAIVRQIILDTHRHQPTIPESAIVQDLDLSILSAIPTKYQKYVSQINDEYSFIQKDDWKIMRRRFLKSMIDKQNIYSTDLFKSKMSTAVQNMEWEVSTLA